MKAFLLLLFFFFILVLIDFTLIDGSFGRNIFEFTNINKNSYLNHFKGRTNLIPFATVRLFFKGYLNDNLSLTDVILNIVGNFLVLAPLPFFLTVFKKKRLNLIYISSVCLAVTLAIEALQFILLTGATDIDDVILNLSGALLFYGVIRIKAVSNFLEKSTFGVWKNYEKEV